MVASGTWSTCNPWRAIALWLGFVVSRDRVFAASGHLGSATIVNAGFGSAMSACAGFSVIGTGVALGVRAKRRRAVHPEPQLAPDAHAPGATMEVGNP